MQRRPNDLLPTRIRRSRGARRSSSSGGRRSRDRPESPASPSFGPMPGHGPRLWPQTPREGTETAPGRKDMDRCPIGLLARPPGRAISRIFGDSGTVVRAVVGRVSEAWPGIASATRPVSARPAHPARIARSLRGRPAAPSRASRLRGQSRTGTAIRAELATRSESHWQRDQSRIGTAITAASASRRRGCRRRSSASAARARGRSGVRPGPPWRGVRRAHRGDSGR